MNDTIPTKISTRRKMRGDEREKLIVQEAIRFFAEHGFEGQTRELAKRMGISHSVIYRHFPSKESLIERVYKDVYLSRWNVEWDTLFTNRSLPLEQRFKRFYTEYTERIFNYEWVRIFVFSGLRGFDINRRYLGLLRSKIIHVACAECRHHFALPDVAAVPVSQREEEHFWALHGSIFYLAIRKYVYQVPIPDDLAPIVCDAVDQYLATYRDTM